MIATLKGVVTVENGKYNKAYMVPNPATPGPAIIINSEICVHCNKCVDVCRRDVLLPNTEVGKPPVVMYSDECWFCGCCVEDCPVPGAIRMEQPLNQRVGWKRKDTGEYFRIGMLNPPTPNNRSPVG